ncbi:MAG: hypothetical protein IPN76_12990 [Saprospiraceae bacterium]|nr:hypothetical protein [Saprospiraceae bacterium]
MRRCRTAEVGKTAVAIACIEEVFCAIPSDDKSIKVAIVVEVGETGPVKGLAVADDGVLMNKSSQPSLFTSTKFTLRLSDGVVTCGPSVIF